MIKQILLLVFSGAVCTWLHADELDDIVAEYGTFKGPSIRGVDTSTLTGKIVVGYQGWFNTPDDGIGMKWKHYSLGKEFRPGACSIDYWPHTSEFPEDARVPTDFKKKDGSTAYVFSSAHPAVVDTHFKWMKTYGIESAFLQRFGSVTRGGNAFKGAIQVLDNVRAAANAHGRSYIVMYDIGALDKAGELELIKQDWKRLVDHMGITRDPRDKAYQYHNGKPLIALWGPGFTSRNMILPEVMDLIKFLRNDPDYGGNAIMLGVPSGFDTLSRDCVDDPYMHELIKAADVISPWAAGRYKMKTLEKHQRYKWVTQVEWCREAGVEYLPCTYPGFSWYNLKKVQDPNAQPNAIPRHDGQFLWRQISLLKQAGATMIYVGMFDEIDEGTQILKVDNNPPEGGGNIFQSYYPQDEDWYLWVTCQAQRMFRGEIPWSETLPDRDGLTGTKSYRGDRFAETAAYKRAEKAIKQANKASVQSPEEIVLYKLLNSDYSSLTSDLSKVRSSRVRAELKKMALVQIKTDKVLYSKYKKLLGKKITLGSKQMKLSKLAKNEVVVAGKKRNDPSGKVVYVTIAFDRIPSHNKYEILKQYHPAGAALWAAKQALEEGSNQLASSYLGKTSIFASKLQAMVQ